MNLITATWVPVFIEPLPFSGERLCLAVSFKRESGEVRSVQAATDRTLACLFGEEAPSIRRLASMATQSLERQLKAGGTDLSPPADGIFFGTPRQIVEETWDAAIRTVLMNTASFSRAIDEAEEDDAEQNATQWAKSVESVIKSRDRMLARQFRQTVTFSRGHNVNIGFINPLLAAEFAVIKPGSSRSAIQQSLSSKLIRLTTARRFGELHRSDRYEVLVKTPRLQDVSETLRGKVEDMIAEAQMTTESIDVDFRPYHDPESAANHIMRAATTA